MTIASHSELLTELDAWMNRSDLSARIPTFIKLFEARMNRQIRAPAMDVTVTATTVTGEESMALPDDFLGMRSLYIDSDPDVVLEAMPLSALRDSYSAAATGAPRAYAVVGSRIILAPAPDGAYTLTQNYYQAIPELTASAPTNWLLTAFPDAYLYGTLAIASAHIVDDARAGVWKSAWDETLAEMHRHFNRQRLPSAPLSLRPTVIE